MPGGGGGEQRPEGSRWPRGSAGSLAAAGEAGPSGVNGAGARRRHVEPPLYRPGPFPGRGGRHGDGCCCQSGGWCGCTSAYCAPKGCSAFKKTQKTHKPSWPEGGC